MEDLLKSRHVTVRCQKCNGEISFANCHCECATRIEELEKERDVLRKAVRAFVIDRHTWDGPLRMAEQAVATIEAQFGPKYLYADLPTADDMLGILKDEDDT